jgi:hypothetical protein
MSTPTTDVEEAKTVKIVYQMTFGTFEVKYKAYLVANLPKIISVFKIVLEFVMGHYMSNR